VHGVPSLVAFVEVVVVTGLLTSSTSSISGSSSSRPRKPSPFGLLLKTPTPRHPFVPPLAPPNVHVPLRFAVSRCHRFVEPRADPICFRVVATERVSIVRRSGEIPDRDLWRWSPVGTAIRSCYRNRALLTIGTDQRPVIFSDTNALIRSVCVRLQERLLCPNTQRGSRESIACAPTFATALGVPFAVARAAPYGSVKIASTSLCRHDRQESTQAVASIWRSLSLPSQTGFPLGVRLTTPALTSGARDGGGRSDRLGCESLVLLSRTRGYGPASGWYAAARSSHR